MSMNLLAAYGGEVDFGAIPAMETVFTPPPTSKPTSAKAMKVDGTSAKATKMPGAGKSGKGTAPSGAPSVSAMPSVSAEPSGAPSVSAMPSVSAAPSGSAKSGKSGPITTSAKAMKLDADASATSSKGSKMPSTGKSGKSTMPSAAPSGDRLTAGLLSGEGEEWSFAYDSSMSMSM